MTNWSSPSVEEILQANGRHKEYRQGLNPWLKCGCQTPAHQQDFSAVKQKKLLLCFLQHSTDTPLLISMLTPFRDKTCAFLKYSLYLIG